MVRLLIIVSAMFFSLQSFGAECGLFRVVKGKVTYQKKNKSKFRKAKVNKKVCSGDKIKTDAASRTKIVMADGNEINISPSTELLIEQYERSASKNEKKVLLNVLYGKIRSNVKDKYKDTKNNHYRVKTKSAVAGVRGTEFMASFNSATNQSRVVTFEGSVAVGQFKNGNFVASVTVKPGQYTSNSPGSNPHPPREVPPQEFVQLDQETNFGSPSDNRDIANDPVGDSVSNDDNKNEDPQQDPQGEAPNDGPANDPQPNENGDGQANLDGPDADGLNGNDGNRDPASAEGDGLGLPPPELEARPSGPDGLPKLPPTIRTPDAFRPDVPVCTQCNDAVLNKDVKVIIVPVLDGSPGATQ